MALALSDPVSSSTATQRAFELWIDRLDRRSRLADIDKAAVRNFPRKVARFANGRDIIRLDEITTHSCLVTEGCVGRFGQTSEGRRQITAIYIPGDMGDLHSAVLPKVSAPLQSMKFATIAFVPHDAIIAAAERSPALARAFWRDCVVDAQVASEWLLNLGQRNAVARVAHVLCELICRYSRLGPIVDSFPLDMTQNQLGEATGLTGVHINRTLRALRDERAIDVKGSRGVVLDWPRLMEIGDFKPDYLHLERSE